MSTIPAALPAINTLLQYGSGTSPETWTTIANVSSYGGPTFAGNVVDVTSHSNDNAWRQKIVTLLDAGEIPFDLFFIPGSTVHNAILEFFMVRGNGTAGNPIDFRLVFPNSAATKWYLYGFFSKFSFSIPVDGVVKASCTITMTDEPIIPGVNA